MRWSRPGTLQAGDLERWLIRVATNLSLDCLRRRKRRAYPGPWLPSPLETRERLDAPDTAAAARRTPHRAWSRPKRYPTRSWSPSKRLSPRARAVLLLVDVLDYSAAEVATILDASEGNVRVLHHRARRTLDGFDVEVVASPGVRERQRSALEQLAPLHDEPGCRGDGGPADRRRAVGDGRRRPIHGAARAAGRPGPCHPLSSRDGAPACADFHARSFAGSMGYRPWSS